MAGTRCPLTKLLVAALIGGYGCTLCQGQAEEAELQPEDVLAALRSNLGAIRDFSYEERSVIRALADGPLESPVIRRVRVRLLGEPHWTVWSCSVEEEETARGRKRKSFGAAGFDGDYRWLVQQDGMGVCLSGQGLVPTYMAYSGIYLGQIGMQPASEEGSIFGPHLLLNAHTTLEPSPAGTGTIILTDGSSRWELDPRLRCMPVRYEWGPADQKVVILLGGYRQFSGRWFPTKLERKGSAAFISEISDIRINEGLTPADLEIPIPYGTSMNYDNDVVRVYGTTNQIETEAGLRSWLAYDDVLDRIPPETEPQSAVGTFVEKRPAAWMWFASGSAAIGLLAWSFPRRATRGRQTTLCATLALGSFAAEPAARADEPPPAAATPAASAARCAYIALAAYGQSPILRDLLAEVARPDAAVESALVDCLSRRGLYARAARLSLDELHAWRYPVIVRLQPGRGVDHPHYAIVTGVRDGQVTLMNPNRYGALLPMSVADFQRAWDGDAVLTSPVPMVTRYGLRAWATGALPVLIAIPLALLVRRVRWGAAGAVAPVLVLLVCVSLCGCSGEHSAASPSSAPTRVTISPTTWDLGDTYPGPARHRFTIENPQARPVTVQRVSASCGCVASGLPVGTTVPAHGICEFELTVDLSAQRGSITQRVTVGFSDGTSQQIQIAARVKRGVYTEPAELRLHGEYPLEEATASVQLLADDGKPFEIISAAAPLASGVSIEKTSSKVVVAFHHENRTELIRDTLRIRTSHPYAPELRVPVVATFALTWELDPPVLFLDAAEEGVQTEGVVRVRSRTGKPFAVLAQEGDPAITPRTSGPRAEHEVTLRISAPAVRTGSRRILVDLPTTLPEAETIPVPVVFIRRPA